MTGRLGRAFGSKNYTLVSTLLSTALMIALFVGIMLSLPLLLGSDKILSRAYGLTGQTLDDAKIYWNIRLLAFPLTLLSMTLVGAP